MVVELGGWTKRPFLVRGYGSEVFFLRTIPSLSLGVADFREISLVTPFPHQSYSFLLTMEKILFLFLSFESVPPFPSTVFLLPQFS